MVLNHSVAKGRHSCPIHPVLIDFDNFKNKIRRKAYYYSKENQQLLCDDNTIKPPVVTKACKSVAQSSRYSEVETF